ncbi:adenosine receptor A3-like [Glandiceps talaboti]
MDYTNLTGHFELEQDIAAAVRIMVFSAVTVFGNILVVTSVLLNKQLWTTGYVFIASLGTVDTISGFYIAVGALPTGFPNSISNRATFCAAAFSVLLWLWSTSIFHLVVIAIDRYLTVTKPLTYLLTMTKSKCLSLITCAWLLGTFVGVLPLIGWLYQPTPKVINCNSPSVIFGGEYLMFICFGVFFVPLLVMCILYGRLGRIAIKQQHSILALHSAVNSTDMPVLSLSRNSVRPSTMPSNDIPIRRMQASNSETRKIRMKIFKKEMRTTKTLLIILGFFALSWMPFSMMLILEYREEGWYNGQLNDIAFSLGMISSAGNPFIYALRDKRLRATFIKILRCRKVY